MRTFSENPSNFNQPKIGNKRRELNQDEFSYQHLMLD